ncbi:hypothetical protein K2173_010925 [Erythroxylum novogranatense]|uniref:BZIP domain-containing protein n=1 Tax=Erythroxylum novogranatense TaxID=1862640 RepID=A0AAV8T123_9ROSI|nr:hypothetical protein K2173_010925 [Erythroxylum novogranatense]
MLDNVNSGHPEGFHSLPIPPGDPLLDPSHDFLSDLPLVFDENYDFDISFDDLENLDFPSENEPFFNSVSNGYVPDGRNSSSQDSGSSGVSGDHVSDVGNYLNFTVSGSGGCDSDSRSSDAAPVRNVSSPLSSQGSRDGGSSGLSESTNPDSPESSNFVVDQKFKVEESNMSSKDSLLKRKKEEEINEEQRNQKVKFSNTEQQSSCVFVSEGDEKRRARLMRNRESAQLSRQRKKHYVEELEEKVRAMHSTITELNSKISFVVAENATLRQQLAGSSGMCPPPMYAPMAYPWAPCPPYVVKPHGSQVPLVPIPRLKQQQSVPVSKGKKVESKKGEGKTKKVASVSFLGLLFFVLLFGGLLPIVDVRFGGYKENNVHQVDFGNGNIYGQHRGRILTVRGHLNTSHEFGNRNFDISNRDHCERGEKGCSEYNMEVKGRSEHLPRSGESVGKGNDSEPLVASLYVPRNDKLVKIDGNLIIHSVLASEKAMASRGAPEMKTKKTGLTAKNDRSLALVIPNVGRNGGSHRHSQQYQRQRALSSGSTDTLQDHLKSSAANGKLQQWFHEGLAGPMLSSGMCNEVFQFDASPSPGAIVPASSVINRTAEKQQNGTYLKNGKHRRILRGLPPHLSSSDLNITAEQVGRSSQSKNLRSNKSASSVVVSVLLDPREAGDSEVDGMITPKSLSRIFVVVLIDSVKYVTYSCVLPRGGPHLVTT